MAIPMVVISLPLPMRTTILDAPLPLLRLLLRHQKVIVAKITGILPQLPHLRVLRFGGDSPYAFPKALVSFTVFLDPLLDLLLVKTLWWYTPVGLGDGLRWRHIAEAWVVIVNWRGHGYVDMRCLSLP